MKDPLENLLARADAAMAVPGTSADIAADVRRRALRRTQLRVAAGVLLVLGLVLLVLRATQRNHSIADRGRDGRAASVAVLKTELRQLNAEARVHQQTASDLVRRLALRKRADALLVAAPDPMEQVQEARSRAASILLKDAGRFEDSNPAEARELYRNTVQLFPETPSAQAARKHLNAGA